MPGLGRTPSNDSTGSGSGVRSSPSLKDWCVCTEAEAKAAAAIQSFASRVRQLPVRDNRAKLPHRFRSRPAFPGTAAAVPEPRQPEQRASFEFARALRAPSSVDQPRDIATLPLFNDLRARKAARRSSQDEEERSANP